MDQLHFIGSRGRSLKKGVLKPRFGYAKDAAR